MPSMYSWLSGLSFIFFFVPRERLIPSPQLLVPGQLQLHDTRVTAACKLEDSHRRLGLIELVIDADEALDTLLHLLRGVACLYVCMYVCMY